MIKTISRSRLKENVRSRYSPGIRLAQEENEKEQNTGQTDTGQKATPVNPNPEIMSVDGRR
jgi:hypothetical protein